MIYLDREGSLVTIMDKEGNIWLTRRKKLRHDSRRRRKACRVIFIPIKKL